MLSPEQYLIIYFITSLLAIDRDVRLLSIYCFVCFIVDEVCLRVFNSTYEFILSSYVIEITLSFLMSMFIKQKTIIFTTSLIALILLVNVLILTSLNWLVERGDLFSYILLIIGVNSGYAINEIIITIIIFYMKDKSNIRILFIYTTILINYFINIIT